MENNNLTLGSLFDGSGGFPLGGLISGITPLWASEVEPFPIRVTTKRFPNMKHYGDVSKLNGAEVPPVDIITFGSPCQDMSVAGKRSGLDGERSGLFYQAVRIVKEMRCKTNGKYPRFVVWENVPGAFSSNKGEDFKAVLEEICKVKDDSISVPQSGKWTNAGEIVGEQFSLAWRVFDAQYWGVPQRRKRIYLVADFAGQCAGKILFESEGVSGYPPKGICPWQGTAGDFEGCTGAAGIGIDGYNGSADEVAATLGVNCGIATGRNGVMVLNDQGGNRMDVTEDLTCTLRAESNHPPLVFENHSQDTRYTGPLEQAPTVSSTYGTGGNNQPFVLETPKTLKIRSGCEGGGKGALIQDDLSATLGCNNDQTLFVPKAYGICSKDSNSMKSDNPHSGIYEADTSRTIDANGGNPACNQGGIVVVEGNGSRPSHKGDGYKESDVMYTLNTIEQHAVVYAIDRESYNCGQNYARKMGISKDGINSTLNAQGPSAVAAPVYSSSKASFFTSAEEELANTLVATDYKDPPIVNDVSEMPEYIVRRLTPTECARLQGFPDWWCNNLGTAEPTEEEIKWWAEVFETHRHIMGTSSKPKTEKQIIKWLKDPHSDSAEYKMWGNGVALPNVVFVLSGIVYYSQLPDFLL
ncbi:DNA cytosine methyltransferase [Hespellia stercorisuis]|uniref:Cytosine-specific methyltransferase n=1 Tax=Hespellia stercorisuis DSM 15480 TaxID=1121950 RepID=A0A1M6IQN4_9FIRM|nr:DNA (cytosine-5-)-methyltransferase [Hespellia stercorisuis]SHJ36715.1 DNA (cytosine-5)-methyltransferase 1 [Hespellia stercorisuis DSM 15480]